jgi:hypothetical protein
VKLINDYQEYSVYETASGRGVIYIKKSKRGNNAAIFDTPEYAEAIALSMAFGGSITLTHRIRKPEVVNA